MQLNVTQNPLSPGFKSPCHHYDHLDYDISHTNGTDFLMPETITRNDNEK
jgi:hypothetical protein